MMIARELSFAMRACLQDGVFLLEQLDAERYAQRCQQVLNASVGAHYRHVLDHFRNLLEHCASGTLDYDQRDRQTPVETDREEALLETARLLSLLDGLPPDWCERPLHITNRIAYRADSITVMSTAARELMFCVMHAFHHYALIRVICGWMGQELPESFGVAPATVLAGTQPTASSHAA